MKIIKSIDKKADKLLSEIGIKNPDLQNLIELGGLVVGGYALYKKFKEKKLKKEEEHNEDEE